MVNIPGTNHNNLNIHNLKQQQQHFSWFQSFVELLVNKSGTTSRDIIHKLI